MQKAKKGGKTSKIFLSKNCKLYDATEINELETGTTPTLKTKNKIAEIKGEECSISDCSSAEDPDSEIKLKNKRVVQKKDALSDKQVQKEEDKPNPIGAWFKDVFMFCGTGNKGCLGKEKMPKDDESTRNYGGMEQKGKKTKLQSFNNPHKKARRRRNSMSSSESSSESDDSISQ
jgi:hypothetical protein